MIYAIYSEAFGDLVEATTSEESAAIWRNENWRVDALPAATESERESVKAIEAWLIENYKRGGHWIFETTNEATHVIQLREHGGNVDAYKNEMARDFEAIEEHAQEVRSA